MGPPSLLAARPILNAFLVILTGSLCYAFTRLYKARMLFIKRKRLGLVRKDQPSLLIPRLGH